MAKKKNDKAVLWLGLGVLGFLWLKSNDTSQAQPANVADQGNEGPATNTNAVSVAPLVSIPFVQPEPIKPPPLPQQDIIHQIETIVPVVTTVTSAVLPHGDRYKENPGYMDYAYILQ